MAFGTILPPEVGPHRSEPPIELLSELGPSEGGLWSGESPTLPIARRLPAGPGLLSGAS